MGYVGHVLVCDTECPHSKLLWLLITTIIEQIFTKGLFCEHFTKLIHFILVAAL